MRTTPPRRLVRRLLPVLPAVLFGCSDPSTMVAPRIESHAHGMAAAVVVVTNTDDSGAGSLRQAIADAAPGTVIQFDAALAGATIVVSSQLEVDKALTIEGSATNGLTISGGLSTRVIWVPAAGNLTLRNVSVVNGRATDAAGIFVNGALLLDHSLIANSESVEAAGGLYVETGAAASIVNSTISGNRAGISGGGILSGGTLIIRNSTITDNTAAIGGGLAFGTGSASLRNSIIAANTSSDPLAPSDNCRLSQSVDLSYLGANFSNDGSCGTEPAMTIGQAWLLPLADNGGPTKTHAITVDSYAFEGGESCTESTDQRYVARPAGNSCDIGAFEFDDFGTFTFTIGNVAVNPKSGVATVSGTVKCSRAGFVELDIALSQTQKVTGRFSTIVQGLQQTAVNSCGVQPTSWSATVSAASKFSNGTATVSLQTLAWKPGFLPASMVATVKVFAVK